MRYILSLDQGTTSCRAILFDEAQNIVAMSQKELTQYYPGSGMVEHDPEEIYTNQFAVMEDALRQSGVDPKEVAAIGITNQRETTVLWDKVTGKPIYNAIVWQCRRTAELCDELTAKGLGDYVTEVTGLKIDAYFSGTKIRWILDHVPGAQEKAEAGEILFGTVDSWLLWNLTGGKVHATDHTNASRTMLYDIHKLKWDEKLLAELRIPVCMLPKVLESSHIFGETEVLGHMIPIAGIAGDQQAALFGQCCFDSGEAKNTYGTGCFLLMNTGNTAVKSRHGLITTIAASAGNKVQYALEGSAFVGGAVVQWLRDELHLINDAKDTEYFASKVADTGGVYLVPAFTGLGAPYWDMYARGTLVGLTRGTKREHIIRASLEAIAYQSRDLVVAMEKDSGICITSLRADGGASMNNFLMQFQADIVGTKMSRPKVNETTALGAAFLAGLAVGVWRDTDEIRNHTTHSKTYSPNMAEEEREKLIKGWDKAVGRSLSWLKD